MAELVLRAGYNDHLVIAELLTDSIALHPRLSRLIRRVVVDATAIAKEPRFAQAAYASGTPLLVDPQTFLLTTEQHSSDNWARLPYAQPEAVDLHELLDPGVRADLIEKVVEFEIDHGGTAIIPPYIHITDFDGVAPKVQRLLIKDTAVHLKDLGLDFPVFPLLSVDQTAISLDPALWPSEMGRLLRAAHKHASGPIGLGLSLTTQPNKSNLHTSSRIWRRAAHAGPFIAWHAGQVGLLAVTMGAEGYEVGMCSGERYNARGQQRSRATASSGGPRYQGAYVEALGRSLERRVVEQLSRIPGTHQGDLGCVDPACCPNGFSTMLGSGRRQHSVRSRLRDLETLSSIGSRKWRLRHLVTQAQDASASARRIRAAARNAGLRIGADPSEHDALLEVAQNLMPTSRVSGSSGAA